jgi:hypothetical protein
MKTIGITKVTLNLTAVNVTADASFDPQEVEDASVLKVTMKTGDMKLDSR